MTVNGYNLFFVTCNFWHHFALVSQQRLANVLEVYPTTIKVSMSEQVTAICRSCFYHQLKSVKSSLTREALHSLIQAFVHCRLDYCNSALAGVAKVYLQKLQSVQNMVARTVSGVRQSEYITPVLEDLHWLYLLVSILKYT